MSRLYVPLVKKCVTLIGFAVGHSESFFNNNVPIHKIDPSVRWIGVDIVYLSLNFHLSEHKEG